MKAAEVRWLFIRHVWYDEDNMFTERKVIHCGVNVFKTFREVAKWGSYTRAAEVLGYAQSSITTQIQKLEESYGAVLVERFGRNMRLTLAGEALLQYANDIYRLHEESKEVVSRQSRGILSIGTIETLAAFSFRRIFRRTANISRKSM